MSQSREDINKQYVKSLGMISSLTDQLKSILVQVPSEVVKSGMQGYGLSLHDKQSEVSSKEMPEKVKSRLGDIQKSEGLVLEFFNRVLSFKRVKETLAYDEASEDAEVTKGITEVMLNRIAGQLEVLNTRQEGTEKILKSAKDAMEEMESGSLPEAIERALVHGPKTDDVLKLGKAAVSVVEVAKGIGFLKEKLRLLEEKNKYETVRAGMETFTRNVGELVTNIQKVYDVTFEEEEPRKMLRSLDNMINNAEGLIKSVEDPLVQKRLQEAYAPLLEKYKEQKKEIEDGIMAMYGFCGDTYEHFKTKHADVLLKKLQDVSSVIQGLDKDGYQRLTTFLQDPARHNMHILDKMVEYKKACDLQQEFGKKLSGTYGKKGLTRGTKLAGEIYRGVRDDMAALFSDDGVRDMLLRQSEDGLDKQLAKTYLAVHQIARRVAQKISDDYKVIGKKNHVMSDDVVRDLYIRAMNKLKEDRELFVSYGLSADFAKKIIEDQITSYDSKLKKDVDGFREFFNQPQTVQKKHGLIQGFRREVGADRAEAILEGGKRYINSVGIDYLPEKNRKEKELAKDLEVVNAIAAEMVKILNDQIKLGSNKSQVPVLEKLKQYTLDKCAEAAEVLLKAGKPINLSSFNGEFRKLLDTGSDLNKDKLLEVYDLVAESVIEKQKEVNKKATVVTLPPLKENFNKSGPVSTNGDGNCAFNALTLGVADLVRTDKKLEAEGFFTYITTKLGIKAPHRDQDGLKTWLTDKSNDVIQKSLAPILREYSVKLITEDYGTYAEGYLEQLKVAFDLYKTFKNIDDTFAVHKFIKDKFVELSKKGVVDPVEQLEAWWLDTGKDLYFEAIKTPAKHALDIDKWGSETEIDVVATNIGINFAVHHHGITSSRGVGGGFIEIVKGIDGNEAVLKLAQDMGIGGPCNGKFRIGDFSSPEALAAAIGSVTMEARAIMEKNDPVYSKEQPVTRNSGNANHIQQLIDRGLLTRIVGTENFYPTPNIDNTPARLDGIPEKYQGLFAHKDIPKITIQQSGSHWTYERSEEMSVALQSKSGIKKKM